MKALCIQIRRGYVQQKTEIQREDEEVDTTVDQQLVKQQLVKQQFYLRLITYNHDKMLKSIYPISSIVKIKITNDRRAQRVKAVARNSTSIKLCIAALDRSNSREPCSLFKKRKKKQHQTCNTLSKDTFDII